MPRRNKNAAKVSRRSLEYWKGCVKQWFPKLLERTYFVPPVHMNRMRYDTVQLGGQDVAIPKEPTSDVASGTDVVLFASDVRDDESQQRILHCFRSLAEKQKEVMVVVSQLRFGDFLGDPCYAAAANALPRSFDFKDDQKRRGDFDLLFIHRKLGIIVSEIKSVGGNFEKMTEEEKVKSIVKKIVLAIQQLKKAQDVLQHLVSDQPKKPKIRKVLMLPNITLAHLQLILNDNAGLNQGLKKCLGFDGVGDSSDLCLCSDHLSDRVTPWEVTDNVLQDGGTFLTHDFLQEIVCQKRPSVLNELRFFSTLFNVLQKLGGWWQRMVSAGGEDPNMSDDLYEDLVARFCGPATMVRVFCVTEPPVHVRTEGEGVSETSKRFTDIVLRPEQLDAVNRRPPLVYLTGPPGTGKTLVLIVMGLEWLREDHHVHVLATCFRSRAASNLIKHQLQTTVGSDGGASNVHFHDYHMLKRETVDEALNEFSGLSDDGQLFILADEAFRDNSNFADFCSELLAKVPGLHLWAASVYHSNRPPCLEEIVLTEPLRTPPVVTREVAKSDHLLSGNVRKYRVGAAPQPCDGPVVRFVHHEGKDHPAENPVDCFQCGVEIGDVLNDLHIGQSNLTPPSTTASPTPISYKDVFVLSWGAVFQEEERNDSGAVVKSASAVVQGIRSKNIPLLVVKAGHEAALVLAGIMDGPDQVVACLATHVSGLERKVVVWIPHSQGDTTDMYWGRLDAISRTTAQLVCVSLPEKT